MRSARSSSAVTLIALLFALSLAGCPQPVSDEDSARIAVEGLEPPLGRAIDLGFSGFNAASSANIPEQEGDGDETGMMIVTGQVDQGSSANKEMRLELLFADYADEASEEGVEVTYDTDGDPVALELSLRDIPDGTVLGTLEGGVVMSGDLTGALALELGVDGAIEEGADGEVAPADGETDITGTATSSYGEFAVSFTF